MPPTDPAFWTSYLQYTLQRYDEALVRQVAGKLAVRETVLKQVQEALVDVVGELGLRAVRILLDPRRLLRVLNPRQGHIEFYGELETTLLGGKQAHPAVDRDITYLGAFTTADHAQSTLEAGRVAHREELFRVRATALAAHLLWRAELHIQDSVVQQGIVVK